MKIAIPVTSDAKDTAVSDIFGRTAMFMIYDTETDASIYIRNEAALSSGGAGIRAAQAVVDNEAGVLLTPQLGSNAAKVLQAAGIKLYKTQPGLSAQENLERFKQGELETLDQIHEGFHRH
ncbi:MAG: NifB/NifX family molybdenum-iron cluster-binding protein [Thermoguttaceae bacterium]|jgi:predicted Fe-Mo cluster-binding NifX family protein